MMSDRLARNIEHFSSELLDCLKPRWSTALSNDTVTSKSSGSWRILHPLLKPGDVLERWEMLQITKVYAISSHDASCKYYWCELASDCVFINEPLPSRWYGHSKHEHFEDADIPGRTSFMRLLHVTCFLVNTDTPSPGKRLNVVRITRRSVVLLPRLKRL